MNGLVAYCNGNRLIQTSYKELNLFAVTVADSTDVTLPTDILENLFSEYNSRRANAEFLSILRNARVSKSAAYCASTIVKASCREFWYGVEDKEQPRHSHRGSGSRLQVKEVAISNALPNDADTSESLWHGRDLA